MKFRLEPTKEQNIALLVNCQTARDVWNLAVKQQTYWRPGLKAPGFVEQCRQLTEARKEFDWLSKGVRVVQIQSLLDFDHAMKDFLKGVHRKPKFHKQKFDEGFRVVGLEYCKIRRLSAKVGVVLVPKAGWVRFRWSRDVGSFKSYRVKLDRSGRWHISFVIKPVAIDEPNNGKVIGIDRGVTVSFATSEGDLHNVPKLSVSERRRFYLLQRKFSRSQTDSKRHEKLRLQIAKINSKEVDRRKDFVEKLTTDLARNYDIIGVEDLKIKNMTKSAKGTLENPGKNVRQKSGLNRAILGSGWGLFVTRLEDKATNSVIKVNPRFTSQKCSSCGFTSKENRDSQAIFHCKKCELVINADINAAINIKNKADGVAASARTLNDGSLAMFVREATMFSEQWWGQLESSSFLEAKRAIQENPLSLIITKDAG